MFSSEGLIVCNEIWLVIKLVNFVNNCVLNIGIMSKYCKILLGGGVGGSVWVFYMLLILV